MEGGVIGRFEAWPSWRVAALIVAAIFTFSCAPQPRNRSPESRLLQSKIVPAIVQWSKGDAPRMKLSEIPEVRSFDYICVVPEYKNHSIIENEVPEVSEYKGITGSHVPEMKLALIGVRNGTAHVGYISLYDLSLQIAPKTCRQSQSAIFLRLQRDRSSTIPIASLGE